jgi:PAS domain S-box-containing protein
MSSSLGCSVPEAAARALSAIFAPLFSAYPDGLLIVDGEGCILLANPEASRLLGYSAAQLLGMKIEALLPTRLRQRHVGLREGFTRAPSARAMGTQAELSALRSDGSEVMVEIGLSPLQHEGQTLMVAALRGIGEYPRVKQAMQRARYGEAMAELATTAALCNDEDELVRAAAACACSALQASTCAVYLFGPSDRRLRVAGGQGLAPDEPEGSLWPETEPSPASGGGRLVAPMRDGTHIMGFVHVRWAQTPTTGPEGADEDRFLQSLAGLLAASLLRLRAQSQLAHAQRLESVGQLTGGIAHDFNNLLTVVLGNLQVLRERAVCQGAGPEQAMLDAASRAAQRGAELTARLLAFSRRQVLRPQRIALDTMIGGLVSMLRRTLEAGIHIDSEVQTGEGGAMLACRADEAQLESALLNLAINARDAMPEGGRLVFSARIATQLPPEWAVAQYGSASPGDWVEVQVRDTGTGMSDDVRARAFEPFFTTKESGRGTGLGLATVYGFARQSGGMAHLESAPGAGTAVSLYLPRWREPAAAAAVPGEADGLPRGLKILLVEDDADVRAVVQRQLQALGAQVHAVSDARSAWAAWAQSADAFGLPWHLVLSDIALGTGERGTALAGRLRAAAPGLPVVLMTGYASGALDQASPWPVLRKPFDQASLRRALIDALNRRSD